MVKLFDEKAQLHTLEGVIASTIILMVILYVIDATSITPLTSSASNSHIETELQVLGENILNVLEYDSSLKYDILKWDGTEYIWNGLSYTAIGNPSKTLDNNLTNYIESLLIEKGIAHKIEILYLTNSSGNIIISNPEKMIESGVPSYNAVIISRKIVIHDNDNIDSHIENIDGNKSNLYNIVDVRITLWRM